MTKKLLIIFIILFLTMIVGISTAFAQLGFTIGGGETFPIVARYSQDYDVGGELSPAIDFGLYYLFDFGGSLGLNFLVLPFAFSRNVSDIQIHILYTHEFILKDILAIGLGGGIGFDILNLNIGFGLRAGGHIAIAPDKYTRIGLRTMFAFGAGSGDLIFGFPMTLFFTVGFDL